MTQAEILLLTYYAKETFKKFESSLTEVRAPVKICGDVHGQFEDMMRIFEEAGHPGLASDYAALDDSPRSTIGTYENW